jgi:predicted AAA+ superfamily ATPase
MKRKIYDALLTWKANDSYRTSLLIDGARRVGKSYIVKKFAKEEYKSYILIDFNKVNNQVKSLFENYLDNLDNFFLYLSAYFGVKLYRRKSLIIFDEVQLFPRARAAIKYLVEDGRYDYIETGTLVSIKANITDIVIPSEEHHIKMNPMDFEEFLWANGNETLMPLIRQNFNNLQCMGSALHRKAMDYFR